MILSLTPNLTLDRVLTLDRPLQAGQLHRVTQISVAAGGKGVNLARVVRALGGEVRVAGVVAGFNGQHFRALLRAEGLNGELVEGDGETRECQIMLDPGGGHPTEVNEAGFVVTADQWDMVMRSIALSGAGTVAVCGSLPPGCTREQFTQLIERLNRPAVDSSGLGLEAALEAGASLIKPNEHELRALTGTDSLASARDLRARSGVDILLTQGERGAAFVGEQVLQAQAPQIEVKNPVGSGDSVLGAFLHARAQGQSPQDALKLGIGAGSANALLGGPLNFDAAVAHDLAAQVRVVEVP